MPHITVEGKVIQLNEEGFIANQEDWNEAVAIAFGVFENIPELTAEHWKVIYYLRDYYRRFSIAPMIRKLCKDTGVSLKEMEKLFPSGPAKGACKLAGLPKPTGCL
jgi:dissimilatory sulfite reductase related protein